MPVRCIDSGAAGRPAHTQAIPVTRGCSTAGSWCSIYQDLQPSCCLSRQQDALRKRALKNMALWYAHSNIAVYIVCEQTDLVIEDENTGLKGRRRSTKH